MTSWMKPTAEQIDRALALLVRPEYARTFFDRLENPEWIEPLRTHGFFHSPPPAQFEDEGRTVVLTKWPASRYLVRIAEQKDGSYAEAVQQALLAIPEDTDNDTVHEDLITAAAALPGNIAAPLAERESRWIKTSKWLHALIPQKLPELIVTLLNDGQIAAALGLLKAALAFRHDAERERLVAKMDAYEYERLIDDVAPALADTAALEGVKVFGMLLNAALNRLHGRDASPDDYSYIWRESISDDHGGDSVENSLASGLIDVACSAVGRDQALLDPIITELRRGRWSLFRRIELFLLTEYGHVSPDRQVAALTDRRTFDDHSVRREYDDLLRRSFGALEEAVREQIFGFIEGGPDIEAHIAFALHWGGEAPTDAELAEYVRNWKRDRLRPIAARVGDRYGELVAGVEDVDANEEIQKLLTARTTSPANAQELGALATPDLVAFLKSWKPPEGALTALTELGDELQAAARAEAARFIADIECFKATHPTFVRSVIEGLAEAVKAGEAIDWHAVLSFCVWVVEQPRLLQLMVSDEVSDPGFSWSRGAVLRLLETGFGSDSSALSPDMHTEIWAVLRPITTDPDPVAADGLPTNYDPSAHALNTIRGQALRTVISYGLWRERVTKQNVEGTPEGAEILAVLNEHLTPDEALAILAVYGEHFPQVLYLFPDWSRERIDSVFPTEAGAERMWNATWPAYVVFCPAYSDVAVLLRAKYLYAASHLDKRYDDWSTLAQPAEKLIEHAVSLYLRSEIALEDELITSLCANSSAEQRGRMIWFTASSLKELDCDSSGEVVARSQRLWEVLIAGRSPRAESDELRSFGWFALSDCVPRVWFLDHLIAVLEMGGVACEHGVIRRLAAMAEEHVAGTVAATMLFVRASTREFGVEAWRKEIVTILNAATRGDATTRRRAIEIIDYLGQQGVQLEGYRSLIARLSQE